MANELMTKPIEYEVNGESVKLSGQMVRDYLVSGNGKVTDQEVVMFLQLCKFQKLNPFLNEAYLVKFGGSPAQIIVSKEAFMKRANGNPHFKGIKAGIMVARGDEIVQLNGAVKLPKDVLIGGWATVDRDDREETHVELSIEEFGKGQSTWKSMPNNMIRKTAMVNALREAFPETLGDMYTEDDKTPNDQPMKQARVTEEPKQSVSDLLNAAPKPEPVEETKKTDSVDDVIEVPDEDLTEHLGEPITDTLDDKEVAENVNSNPEDLFGQLADLN